VRISKLFLLIIGLQPNCFLHVFIARGLKITCHKIELDTKRKGEIRNKYEMKNMDFHFRIRYKVNLRYLSYLVTSVQYY
jgi:hypothetical protein